MKTSRERTWLCTSCGYAMDAVSSPFGDAVPDQDDASICINCGKLYRRDAGRWTEPTPEWLASLHPETRREIARAQAARQAARFPDLAKRGGRT